MRKVNLVKEHRAWHSCLKFGRRSWGCTIRKQWAQDSCTKYHHEFLHLAHSSGADIHTSGAVGKNKNSESCILLWMSVKTDTSKQILITVFWDGRATHHIHCSWSSWADWQRCTNYSNKGRSKTIVNDLQNLHITFDIFKSKNCEI